MQTNVFRRGIRDWLVAFGITAPDIEIDALTLDSRQVALHTGFIAVAGHQRDGREFIPQAISLGAPVVLAECDDAASHGDVDMREHTLVISFYRLQQQLSALAGAFYQQPSKQLDLIAVTGTNGKTSTVQLASQLAHYLDVPSASIGTLGAGLWGEVLDTTLNTTPDAISMQKLLAQFIEEGAKQVAIEASSHALVQGRISDLYTKVAVFTNLSRDHLDYHGTMEEYAAAKRMLLEQPGLRYMVVNSDDPQSLDWLKACPKGVKPVLFGIQDTPLMAEKYCYATEIEYHSAGVRMQIDSYWGRGVCEVALLGGFNVSNLLGAIASQLCLGRPFEQVLAACKNITPVPGRLEVFSNAQGANVVVDYAHTPDGLEKALEATRQHCHGALWCVFGCGGDRDKGKRPLMGRIAEANAEHIIVTNDNSRSESPQAIADDILSGLALPANAQVELDRQQAIRLALKQAQLDDLILVAGKGHEDYQIIGEQTLPYNERAFVQQLLQEMGQ